jgi:hypothetical protein
VPLLTGSQDLGGDIIPTEGRAPHPNAADNIAKWAAELAEFELDFIPHHAVKNQVVADFVADSTSPPCHLGGPDNIESVPRALVFTGPHWTLYFDGSSRK